MAAHGQTDSSLLSRWEGITCNPEGWVTHLLLPSKGLDGVIFTSSSLLGNLTHLTHFNLTRNSLQGSLENKLFESLNRLEILDLSYNLLFGELPLSLTSGHSICQAIASMIFRVGHNNLSGLLPEDIYNATKLEKVAVPLSSLYGRISERIINLTNLAILDLSFNQLSGVLPLRLGKLSRLKIITLDFNDLQGLLPQSLMNCTNLVELRLGQNNLEGDITKLNFSKLVQLTKLDLYRNNFTGKLPTSLYSCRSLKAIRLGPNNLEGQIQPEILSLNSLSFLSLTGTPLENDTGAMKILMHCKSLRTLLLSKAFNGEGMPSDDDMVRFDGFRNLRFLSLASNSLVDYLYGEFPKELCRVPALVHKSIAAQADQYDLELPIYSMDTGNGFPRRLSSFPPLLDLSSNNITGNIPSKIGQLQLFQILLLSNNNFSGNIQDQISNLKNLEVQSQQALSSKALKLLHLRGIQNFVVHECRIDAHDKNNRDDEDNGHQLPWFYISAVLGFIFGFWGVCGSLIVKKTWRFAYFQFIDNVQDRLYVMLAVRMNRMKRWLS
ncbi:unnamed protein product [Malus baccata var. baccata]